MGDKLDMLAAGRKPPPHFWLVGLASLLWNAVGTFITISSQTGVLPHLRSEERAYFASQEPWLVALVDIGLLAGIAGAIALLLQHRSATALYATMFGIMVAANLHDLASGISPMITAPSTIAPSIGLLAIMALQAIYAWLMYRRGLLE